MRLFKVVFISAIAIALALFLIGQAIIAYNHNRAPVDKAARAAAETGKEVGKVAGKAFEESITAVSDFAKKQ